jgi:hypothetical protein
MYVYSLYVQGYTNSIVKGPTRRVQKKVSRRPDMPEDLSE